MATYFITGASRGIGLELTKQLLELPTSKVSKVFASSRGDPAAPLRDLMSSNPNRCIHIFASVDDIKSIEKAAVDVKAILGQSGLDVLVNNAGIQLYNQGGIRALSPDELAHALDVNLIGPQRVTAAFLPLLEEGGEKKVINVSTTVGSIAMIETFSMVPAPSYKISKAALNMLNALYALEHANDGFTFLCVSPGWLKTDMGGDIADLDIEIGVKELTRIILESGQEQNGKFVNIQVPGQENIYNGGEIPW